MIKKKRKAFKKKKLSQDQLQAAIARFLIKNPKVKYNSKELIRNLKFKNSKDSVTAALQVLLSKDIVSVFNGKYKINKHKQISQKVKKGREVSKKKGKTLKGKIEFIRSGAAYVICDVEMDDIYIPKKFVANALDGDTVLVELTRFAKGRRPEGVISEVISRASTKFVGNLHVLKGHAYVFVDHPKINIDVKVTKRNMGDAVDGDRVIVQISEFEDGHKRSFQGKIVSILDSSDKNEMEMNSILINHGFDIQFDDEVLAETAKLNDNIEEKDLVLRKDFREVLTFTIDPHDAKDFDDAISYQKLDGDLIEIGVHIADVTHFVKQNTALDKEALKRSTSVYLVDRVCPMLPEKISNELCSLRPNEDKFTFSAIFTFDQEFKIKNRWFGKTLIHSDKRFTYEEAQEVLESGIGPMAEELKVVAAIAEHLRKDRFKNGAINFESDEVKFKLDEKGAPIGVFTKQRKEANLLIEDFMLLANKEVAKYISKKANGQEIPFVYRVHDEPNQERLRDFSLFAKELGIKIKIDTPANISKSLNKLAAQAKENDLVKILQPLAIRTMAKAEYTSDNIGHYGLAFEYYTHFTSPIRRYSDVLVHRLLFKNLKEVNRVNKENLEAQCKHISAQERKAIVCERESKKYKQVEFLLDKIGVEFEAVVSGIIEKGFFVQLEESKAEGLIRFNTLKDSFFYEEGSYKAVGKKSGIQIKMGDRLKVKLIDADLDKKELDFELVDVNQ